MKYKLEYFSERTTLWIHCDQRLTDQRSEEWHYADIHSPTPTPFITPMPAPVLDMLNVEGMIKVVLTPYKFVLERALLVEWESILPKVLQIIRKYYDPEGDLIEAGAALSGLPNQQTVASGKDITGTMTATK